MISPVDITNLPYPSRATNRSQTSHLHANRSQPAERGLARCTALALAGALTLATSLPRPVSAHPEIPGPRQQQPIALVGASIHPVTGPVIEEGTLLFDKGRIVAIAKDTKIPANAKRVDVTGKHIYPGLINAYGSLGLTEINSVRATIDTSEVGQINPNVKAPVAINPDSELIPVARSNGILLALTAPTGGLISGTSAVIQLDGWTWEDMTVMAPIGMHVNWPRLSATGRNQENSGPPVDSALGSFRQAWDDAKAYWRTKQDANASDVKATDLRWEAMIPVFQRRIPLIVRANNLLQIETMVTFAVEENVRVILLGGYDAVHCADLLRKHNIPVIVDGVYRLPRRRSDHYDHAYTLPNRLRQARIRFCICNGGRFAEANARNLPYHAATAAAYGLPRDDALKSITIHPATILGVADRVGSLEAGKDATLIITTGDPLETPTEVEAAYIRGRQVDLNNRHKRLWHKYQRKYARGQRAESAPAR